MFVEKCRKMLSLPCEKRITKNTRIVNEQMVL